MQQERNRQVDQALTGDKQALESLLLAVQDMVFGLSLRMLGMPSDAEDATQEILIKAMTQLSSFKKESAFSTWVYRIAVNYLLDYKKSMFAKQPLSFELYGADIDRGFGNQEAALQVDQELLTNELKQSCTNVMLQCLEPQSRVIYVLGVMFHLDSKICGEILQITPEAYRQKLSRVRKQMGAFLSDYCGLSGTGRCDCSKRVEYAIATHRLNPQNLEYHALTQQSQDAEGLMQAMEEMDELSAIFVRLPRYGAPERVRRFTKELLSCESMQVIRGKDH